MKHTTDLQPTLEAAMQLPEVQVLMRPALYAELKQRLGGEK